MYSEEKGGRGEKGFFYCSKAGCLIEPSNKILHAVVVLCTFNHYLS